MKIGVLGRGSIGERHFKNLQALGIDVVSFDTKSDFVALQTRQAVIDSSDAIVIATPTAEHHRDLRDCLAAGKHVFVEKPIAATTMELEQLLKSKSTVVFVGNNLRYHACVRAAKEKLLLGAIGKPLWASITVGQFSDKEPYLRDGVTLNWGAHEIDLALHLLGPAKVRSSVTDVSDSLVDIVLEHDSGCRSIIHLDYVTRPEIRATTIIGEKGQLTIDLAARWCCLIDQSGQPPMQMRTTDTWDSNYIDEMKGFLARINGHNDGIGATGEDGLATLKIIEAVKEKAKA